MDFIDEARGYVSAYNRNRCNVHAWLQTQDDLTEDTLRKAREVATVKAILLTMQKRGFGFQRTSLERHFRGECSCPTS